jgi:serine phosphatase RsbU (regulator of sigma subunit)
LAIFGFVFLKRLILVYFLLLHSFCFAQKTGRDSLPYLTFIRAYEALNKSNNHTDSIIKVIDNYIATCKKRNDAFFLSDALIKKSVVFYYNNNYDSATFEGRRAIQSALESNNLVVQMRGYNVLGAIDYNLGDLKSAEQNYLKRLRIASKIADSSVFYASYYNLGLVYVQQGNYLKSAEINFKALGYFEQKKDTFNLLSSLEIIGYCYQNLEDLPTALKFYHRAAAYSKSQKDKYQLTGILLDLFNVHNTLKNNDSAKYYIEDALNLAKKEKDEFHYTLALNRKSEFLLEGKKAEEALPYIWEAIQTNLKSQRVLNLCEDYKVISKIYLAAEKSDSALFYAYKGYAIALQQKQSVITSACANVLFKVFQKRKQADSALKYYIETTTINDSLKKESQLRGIGQREQLFEKQTQEKMYRQEQAMAQEKINRQKQINLIIGIASCVLLLLLIMSIINYRQKLKANVLISTQKKILEERNKEVQDSINYASRIQRSIMPDEVTLQTQFPNFSILYLPRDIVSGDFYWINTLPNRKNIIVFAIADCTGHGVPGAFMSLIGATLLNQTLTHSDVSTPAQALEHLNKELPKNIKSGKQDETIKDGMELSMCLINYDTLELEFSGANNNLYIARNNELILIKGDKQPIGQGYQTDYHYTNHKFQLQLNDCVYLFTDGYPDQFGGPIGKKFKYKQLEDLILKNARLPIHQQKTELLNTFNKWKGHLEQVDDVLLLITKI